MSRKDHAKQQVTGNFFICLKLALNPECLTMMKESKQLVTLSAKLRLIQDEPVVKGGGNQSTRRKPSPNPSH